MVLCFVAPCMNRSRSISSFWPAEMVKPGARETWFEEKVFASQPCILICRESHFSRGVPHNLGVV